MKKNKRRETKFTRFARRVMTLSFIIFVVGIVGLNSYESSLNINYQKLEKDIATIESDIDGLDLQKRELASFERVKKVAEDKGYTQKTGSDTAAVKGVQRD